MPTVMRLSGQEHCLEIVARWPDLVVRLDGRQHVVRHAATADGAIEIEGLPFRFHTAHDDTQIHLRRAGHTYLVEVPNPRDLGHSDRAAADEIVADMPGTLVQIAKHVGEEVAAGEHVVTIESMKLQMYLSAPRAGRIARIAVAPNQAFNKGATLVVLAPLEES